MGCAARTREGDTTVAPSAADPARNVRREAKARTVHLLKRTACSFLAVALLAVPAAAFGGAGVNNPNVPAGEGDAIFALTGDGILIPVAVRNHGAFIAPGSNDGGPPEHLRTEANAAIAAHGNRVHVIFGGRPIGTVAATVEDGAARVTGLRTLHLGGYVTALASPTLTGTARSARRAPIQTERTAALAFAAAKLQTTPSRLTVRNLTAIDLGHGPSLAGTLNLRGTTSPRTDKRVFMVLEPNGKQYAATLFTIQKITVTEPLLEEPAEYLVDTINLDANTPALVTHIIGYDADTFAIYTRQNGAWKQAYTGGGAAL
jgi:hypothetical protein